MHATADLAPAASSSVTVSAAILVCALLFCVATVVVAVRVVVFFVVIVDFVGIDGIIVEFFVRLVESCSDQLVIQLVVKRRSRFVINVSCR